MSPAQLIGFDDYAGAGQRLAQALDIPFAAASIHHFPDGERKLCLPAPLAEHVIFCRSLNDPDHKLIELLLAAGSARDNGATRLTLVAPYLAYMRQDIAFHPGEAVSQRIIGKLLAEAFDAVITVDAHLHRIDHLSQAIPLTHAINLTATQAMGEFIARNCPDALLLGPDGESRQWVAAVAVAAGGLDFGVATKTRRGDRDVSIEMPALAFQGRTVILVDDVASTGRTLAIAAKQARGAGASAAHCLVTHGLFMGDSLAQLKAAGVDQVWSTDSVPHPSNCIELAWLLASSVKNIID